MAGCVVQVFFVPAACPRPDLQFEMIETEFEDFAGFCEAVDAGGLICASILLTRPAAERGERLVTGRRPFAFRGASVLRAQLPTYRMVEEIDG